jgi:cytochrome c peroxidase
MIWTRILTACFPAGALAALAVVSSTLAQNSGQREMAPLPAVAPSPAGNPATPEKIALGKQLFFDPRLSGDNQMSCATCHMPEKAFTDGLPKAKGADGKELPRNTPTLVNVGFYENYFWDGRAESLEDQALTPIQSADEMNQDLGELVKELSAVPGYAAQFQSAFGGSVTRKTIAQALAAFQRTLITRDSDFDRYLAGEVSALSGNAREGWEIFQQAGCIRCHSGPNLSDSGFHRLGVSFRDKGRGAATRSKQDLYTFRTPGLRDVAKTAPYMHDGSLATLTDVVEFYYRSTSMPATGGLSLSFQPLNYRSFSEVALVVAFLESLSGGSPAITAPRLPAGEEDRGVK